MSTTRYWFFSAQAKPDSAFGTPSFFSGVSLEHPFHTVEKLGKRYRATLLLIAFQPISKEEYDLYRSITPDTHEA